MPFDTSLSARPKFCLYESNCIEQNRKCQFSCFALPYSWLIFWSRAHIIFLSPFSIFFCLLFSLKVFLRKNSVESFDQDSQSYFRFLKNWNKKEWTRQERIKRVELTLSKRGLFSWTLILIYTGSLQQDFQA